MSRHRHERTSWILSGAVGAWEWCYQCGAHRPLRSIGGNELAADGKWVKPTGIGGKNPALTAGDKHG